MNVVILFNPRSGRGRAPVVVDALHRMFHQLGIGCRFVRIDAPTLNDNPEFLDAARALIVIGGDGTVRHAAHAAIRTATPIYHFPLGTENLFARQHAMTRDPAQLLRALTQWETKLTDVARINDALCLLMCSMGPDASVIHRLAARRGRTIHRLSYAGPIAHELLHPHLPHVDIEVDARTVVHNERGMVLIANSRRYALGIDPATTASVTDGLLDLVFLPARTAAGVVNHLAAAKLGFLAAHPDVVRTRGSMIRVAAHTSELPIQIDGEPCGQIHTHHPLTITIEPRRLPVLAPSQTS